MGWPFSRRVQDEDRLLTTPLATSYLLLATYLQDEDRVDLAQVHLPQVLHAGRVRLDLLQPAAAQRTRCVGGRGGTRLAQYRDRAAGRRDLEGGGGSEGKGGGGGEGKGKCRGEGEGEGGGEAKMRARARVAQTSSICASKSGI